MYLVATAMGLGPCALGSGNSDRLLEDLGVRCDRLHRRTRWDVFEDAADLYDDAARTLIGMMQTDRGPRLMNS
jgi:hypothetical protein